MNNQAKEDIIDLLFEKKEDESLFELGNCRLLTLDKNIEEKTGKLLKFIDKRVHPKSRNFLKQLIRQQQSAIMSYFQYESQLYYKNGISDGIELMLLHKNYQKK